jgi:hypothetical protein
MKRLKFGEPKASSDSPWPIPGHVWMKESLHPHALKRTLVVSVKALKKELSDVGKRVLSDGRIAMT